MVLSEILQLPSPLELIDNNYRDKGVQLFIKRDDLIHPWINGNKYRKLNLNIASYYQERKEGIISFGGAFSNHLVALSCICHFLNIPFIAIVRSYDWDHNNPILKLLKQWGAELIPVHPKEYKLKEESALIKEIIKRNEYYMVIPEGGTNELAVKGTGSIWTEIGSQSEYVNDFITVCSAGTAGTFAGISNQMRDQSKLIVGSPFKADVTHLKGFAWLNDMIPLSQIVNVSNGKRFGKYDKDIVNYINTFYQEYGILLDPLYTAKTMYWLDQSIEERRFEPGSKIVFIHTGGLSGIIGYNYLHGDKQEIKIPSEYGHLSNPEITKG